MTVETNLRSPNLWSGSPTCASAHRHKSCRNAHMLPLVCPEFLLEIPRFPNLRTRLVEDHPLVNLAAPQTLRKVRRTNRILAIICSSNYSLLSDAVRPPQALLSKTICSSHSSSGVLPVPQNSSRSRSPRGPHALLWRPCGPLVMLLSPPHKLAISQHESASERPGISKPDIFSVTT